MSILKDIFTRISVDWGEFIDHHKRMWALRMDAKRIKRAIAIAKSRNKVDGRRYWVIRDVRGFPFAYNRSEIKIMKRRGVINQETSHIELDRTALFVIDKDRVTGEQEVSDLRTGKGLKKILNL